MGVLLSIIEVQGLEQTLIAASLCRIYCSSEVGKLCLIIIIIIIIIITIALSLSDGQTTLLVRHSKSPCS